MKMSLELIRNKYDKKPYQNSKKALLESDLQCGFKNIALFHCDLNPKYFITFEPLNFSDCSVLDGETPARAIDVTYTLTELNRSSSANAELN